MAVLQAKASKEKKPASPLHPSYSEMIKEAISALKERTGSSQPAIAKFLEDKYKSKLPANFRKLLSSMLRRMAKSEKLVKVKNSYKLSAPSAKAPVKKPAAAAKPKKEAPKKTKEAAAPKKPKAPAKKKPAAAAPAAKKVAAKKKPAVGPAKKKVVAKSPVGKKRTVKSIKSPKKAPPAKRAKVSA